MNLRQIFAQAFVRRLAYVVVALLLTAVGLGRAEAGNPITVCGKLYAYGGNPSTDTHQGLQEAAAHCATEPTEYIEIAGQSHHLVYAQSQGCTVVGTTIRKSYARGPKRIDANTCQTYNDGPNDGYMATAMTHTFTDGCPAGTTWNASSGTCHDPSACLAKPLGGAMTVTGSTSAGNYCDGGCKFEAASTSITVPTSDGKFMTYSPIWQPTGDACSAGDSPKPPSTTKQQCTPIAGQTVCVRNDGKMCHSASSGKQFCWEPGQTGEQTDANDLQKRNAGNTPVQPTMTLPNGDTLVQNGQPVTTTTSVTNNNTTNNVTTTVTNYQTQNGTNAGTSNTGQPSDGTSTGGEGEGDGTEGAIKSLHADLKGDGNEGAGTDPSAAWDTTGDDVSPDTGGYGLARSCPPPPTITIGGMSRTIDTSALCDLGDIIAAMVLLMAAAHFIYAFTR